MTANSENPPILELNGLSVGLDGRSFVADASIALKQDEIGAIVGPSGCGKSTLLRCIAGFETPLSGEIRVNGKVCSSPQHVIAPENRGISMMFQDLTLFPHLSISENIAFGLRGWSPAERSERVDHLLDIFGLSGFGNRQPHSLSGGEQQRVALARAIAPQPRLVLLDEAFSSLDAGLRHTLVPEVRDILKQEKISAILVTHDHHEAFAIADVVGVMKKGRIQQWDAPYRIYHSPRNRFIATFVGEGELIHATAVDKNSLDSVFGELTVHDEVGLQKGERVEVLFRPDDILHDDDSHILGEVVRKSFRGSHFHYLVKLSDGQHAVCLADSHHNHHVGEKIGLQPNVRHVVFFRPDGSESSYYRRNSESS